MTRVGIKIEGADFLGDWAEAVAELLKLWPTADADLRGRMGVALVKISKLKYLSGQIIKYIGINSGNPWKNIAGRPTVAYYLAGKGKRARASVVSNPIHLFPKKARNWINSLKNEVPGGFNTQGERGLKHLTKEFDSGLK